MKAKISPTTIAAVSVAVIALVIGGIGIASAETETPTPVATETGTPTPDPTPTETPTPTTTVTPEQEQPQPVPPAVVQQTTQVQVQVTSPNQLPVATTVAGAISLSIATYCTSPAPSALDKANWHVSDANEALVTGAWSVWAMSTRGQLAVLVTPQDTQAIVTPDSDLTRLAFTAWGCPMVMVVGRM